MRMSCNGCRVLRKGCGENCSIRPCLQWIKTPESQANVTVFLAKFYGRAGLMNSINSGPDHLRPAIFRSLLYEACGRIVDPIDGSVGLLRSNCWHLCQAAVESVLRGEPIVRIPSESAPSAAPPLKDYDIRHLTRGSDPASSGPAAALHRVHRSGRTRFKRAEARGAVSRDPAESSGSHATEHEESSASHVSQGTPGEESEVELELTLGFDPSGRVSRPVGAGPETLRDYENGTRQVDLGPELSA